jgi:hypothetical protein
LFVCRTRMISSINCNLDMNKDRFVANSTPCRKQRKWKERLIAGLKCSSRAWRDLIAQKALERHENEIKIMTDPAWDSDGYRDENRARRPKEL